ncbi:E3 SUMO-protein ligase RanBP2-like [Aphidius gifuensis]|uniref:E3 SUMO-protein ligase RanBP2-like n=1 Tax=Aphidius gifuensis TaxID=684658 RepID=UPI001CDCFB6E|nr:E3 SUMO-protein ligase RanBP2-like [Aphidius gifuensis]
MFRNKVAVDRHVQEQFRKVTDEKERNLRCYNIAKLYYSVQDYDSARHYVSSYLEVKSESAPAHKLLGEIFEALGQKQKALVQYKQSLELEGRQDDLVLKVCELLTDTDVSVDVNSVKYWTERASDKFPNHSIIFRLKERMLISEKTDVTNEDLEALIISELSARPSDIELRVKLIKYYQSKKRLDDAFQHAIDIESKFSHRDSLIWYETLCALLTQYKDTKQQKWSFWILYLSCLERYAALSIKEQGIQIPKSIEDAIQAVSNFDQALTESKQHNIDNNTKFTEQMYCHMFAQLNYHLACLIIRRTKREQGSWTEAGRLCAPLLLTAMHSSPIDTVAPLSANIKAQSNQAQVDIWHREGAYRCSQAAHVLQDYIRNDVKRLTDKIEKFCIGSWRERLYQRIFTSKKYSTIMSKSYFANDTTKNSPMRLLSSTELAEYDEISEQVFPASLHHHVWLGIVNKPKPLKSQNLQSKSINSVPIKNQQCHVFKNLQISAHNLNQASPDSLSQLDIDAFLNATILCSSVIVEDHKKSGFLNPDRFPTLPADLTNTLCTSVQEKWWLSAYKMYNNQDGNNIGGDIGELRQELQFGLEIVRCIGNHGLHPTIIVQLARIFQYRAKLLRENENSDETLNYLERRYELYWSTVIPLLERLLNNQSIRFIITKVFDYQGGDMNNLELSNALEEGRLTLAEIMVKEKKYEEAVASLQILKCPESSCLQGDVYKILADESSISYEKNNITSPLRSDHIIMLTKAKNCYYLTLDRLRSPGMNPNHPLNAELGNKILSIENELKKIDPDYVNHHTNRNNDDNCASDESYSSAHSDEQHSIFYASNSVLHGTPRVNKVRTTPKQSSTPRISQQERLFNDSTRSRVHFEARPSPERLDAQIRQLIHSKDSMISTVVEQYKIILESNKTLVESNKNMKDMLEELRREFNEFRKDSAQKRDLRQSNINHTNNDTGSYGFEDDVYDNLTDHTQNLSLQQQQQRPRYAPVPFGYKTPIVSHMQSPAMPPNMFATPRAPFSPHDYSQANPLSNDYYNTMQPFLQQNYNDPYNQAMGPTIYGTPSRPIYPPQVFSRTPSVDQSPIGGIPPQVLPGQTPASFMMPRMMAPLSQETHLPQNVALAQMQQMIDLTRQGMSDTSITSTPPPPPPQQQQQQLQQIQIQQQQQQIQQQQQVQQQQQTPRSSILGQILQKNPLVNKAPPVNVVITKSDTVPTTVPPVQPTMSVTIPPQHINSGNSINMQQNNYSLNNTVENIPHTYQMTMPSHAIIPTTVIHPPLSATITNTIAAGAEKSKHNVSLLSTGSHNSSTDAAEVEHDPIPDFKPIIPLPDEITVTTGEEDEEELYCARAKLFRYSDKEWKDRGVGNVKLLKNTEGKVRLLMRREQVLKICANHFLTADMELSPMMNSDRAWTWAANDFADQEVKLETLAIRFKLPAEAQSFKEHFDKAKASLPLSPVKPVKKSQPPVTSTQTTTATPVTTSSSSSVVLGGFSFSTTPIIQQKTSVDTKKNEETAKPSPFSGFSFTKTTDSPAAPVDFSFNQKSVIQNTKTTATAVASKPSLAEMFKPEVGSWECKSCYTRNTSSNVKCLACEGPSPNAPAPIVKEAPIQNAKITSAAPPPPTTTTTTGKPSLSEMFKPEVGSWECKSCYTRNKSSSVKCLACEGPSPNAPAASANDTTNKSSVIASTPFTFGIPAAVQTNQNTLSTAKPLFNDIFKNKSETSVGATPAFSFGIPANKETSSFNFKAPVIDDKNKIGESKSFEGFSTKPPSTDFNFSNQEAKNLPSKSPFSFGSPGKSFEFHLASKSPVKSSGGGGGDDASDDEVVESEDIYFAPVIPLPDKIDVKTGEEDEEVLYTHRSKLFRYDSNTKEWKERGLGDIKILRHTVTKKLRLVMRRDRTLKLCLNQYVPRDLEITSKDEKTWLWKASDFSEGEIEHVSLACRFKNSEIAELFKKAIDNAIAAIDINETPSSASTASPQDIQVLFELSVTDEEKNAALKLKLPENFYSYKQKDDCKGCRGCQESDVSLFDDKKNKGTTSKTPSQVIKLDPPKLTPPTKTQFSATTTTTAAATTTTTTTNSNIFSFQKSPIQPTETKQLKHGTLASIINHPQDIKSGFSFGGTKNNNNNDSVVRNLFGGTPSICSPTTAPQTDSPFGKNVFGEKSSIFGQQSLPTFASVGSTNIFGGATPVKTSEASSTTTTTAMPLFGGAPTFATAFGMTKNSETSNKTSENIFGSAAKDSSTSTLFSNGNNLFSANTTNNNETTSTPPVFGNTSSFGSNFSFGGLATTTPSTTSIFGGKQPLTSTTDEKKETTVPSFLKTAENTVTFEALAAGTSKPAGFTTNPNFSFAGAGQSVFGSKTPQSSTKKTPQKNEDNDKDADEENDDGQDGEYDPHYEPIIPLPDAIEVKTGEEDEEALFCQRAKLYRYETETKEWKERGVGDMKILHHVEQGRYRLLLRREQVYKVVCNMALTSDFDLQPLQTSDRAWVWGGTNYAEDTPSVEKLAVRFKNPELAMNFKDVVDRAIEDLCTRPKNDSHQNHEGEEEDDEEEDDDVDDVDDDGGHNNEDTDEGDEGDDDDDEVSYSFFKVANLLTLEENEFVPVCQNGIVKIYYDSEVFASRIVFENDHGEILCSVVTVWQLEVELDGNCCTWTAYDEFFEIPIRRTMKLEFQVESDAVEFYNNVRDNVEESGFSKVSEDMYY